MAKKTLADHQAGIPKLAEAVTAAKKSGDSAAVRAAGKKLRRAQRRVRSLKAAEAKRTAKAGADEAPADAGETAEAG